MGEGGTAAGVSPYHQQPSPTGDLSADGWYSMPPTNRAVPPTSQRSMLTTSQASYTPPSSNRRFTPPPSDRTSAPSHWAPPSWDARRATPPDQVYRSAVGGVKLGYSGHLPQASDNVGSSDFGNSNFSNPSQRDHSTRVHSSAVEADRGWSHKAATSAVGYKGHKPTERDGVATSYWQGYAPTPAGGDPRMRDMQMRDLLSA